MSPRCDGRYRGKVCAQRRQNFFVMARCPCGKFSNFTLNSLAHCICKQTKQIKVNQARTSRLQFGRPESIMLCANHCIFNLLCAFNCFQPMKKIVFSVASRAYKLSRVALGTRMNPKWRLPVVLPRNHAAAPCHTKIYGHFFLCELMNRLFLLTAPLNLVEKRYMNGFFLLL